MKKQNNSQVASCIWTCTRATNTGQALWETLMIVL